MKPNYGFEEGAPRFCAVHKLDGMQNLSRGRCKVGEALRGGLLCLSSSILRIYVYRSFVEICRSLHSSVCPFHSRQGYFYLRLTIL